MKSLFSGGKTLLLILIITAMNSCSESKDQVYKDHLAPEETINRLELNSNFNIEIFATEPHVFDPVALEFDEEGNIYVVEMPDYPYEVEPGEGKGRIRLLKDTNNDGQIDESIIFAENLTEATSILPWQGGLIVTAAPNILYLQDTDGDGKSDTSEILFSGFFEDNSEAQITSLRFGVDNWIYANNRGQKGLVTFSRNPDAPAVPMSGADFRFRLDTDQFELETGPGQFGQTIDDWGHRFFSENSIHIQQVVIPWRYTHRHECLPSTRAIVNISDHEEIMHQKSEPPYWRAERTRRRNATYQENNMNRVEHAEGYFTAATGGTIYTGDAFPEEFYGNIFTGDVSGHLVHRDILVPSDSSPVYIARRHNEELENEFLFTSKDPWFRPVDFTVGPDGYLYVLDFYRQHIETPVSIPDDLKEEMDFMAGSDMGRIYRVVPKNAETQAVSFNLKDADSSRLLEALSNPNQWWRLTAQRLLLERQDKTIIPAVKDLFSNSPDARARLHALYVLEGLDALDRQIVEQAMEDDAPGVRENAIILAERFLPATLPGIINKIDDSSLMVAFQAALSLGESEDNQTISAFANVIEKYGQDQWFRMAVLSSENGSSSLLLKELVQQGIFSDMETAWKPVFLEQISYIIGCRKNDQQINEYLDLITDLNAGDNFKTAALASFIKGLNKNISEDDSELKEKLSEIDPNSPDEAVKNLKELY